jgi:hypothetical protein
MQYFVVNKVITNLKVKKQSKWRLNHTKKFGKNVINIVLYLDHVENFGYLKSLISFYIRVFKL